MDARKKAALEAAGYRLADAEDFLGMTREERAFLELRFRLARAIKSRRVGRGETQKAAAARIGSGQARFAKIEGPSHEVSLDLMFRALFALGGSLGELVPDEMGAAPQQG